MTPSASLFLRLHRPRFIRTRALLALALCGLAWLAAPRLAAAGRPELALAEEWRFQLGGEVDAREVATGAWTRISLPHTWNARDGADGGADYARGAGWYAREVAVPASWSGKRIFLQFDGANRNATVFLNGRHIGGHVGGYARFRFDVTDAVSFGASNALLVKVDNSADGTPPISADYTLFGGLYRPVKLFAVAPVHLDVLDHGANGVFVTPHAVSAARANFSVRVQLKNDSGRAQPAHVHVAIRDAQGRVVAAREDALELAAGQGASLVLPFSLNSPRRWNGRADPHLYAAQVTVTTAGGERDETVERFGLRSFSVDPERGFFLNGRPHDLRGVNRHQDRAGKGWAVSEADEREDFALIEELGATAIRVAHYPQSSLWFDLADERGFVLWAEIPVVNEVPADARYADNARQQLRELIRQNYNRPSIAFWGVGNETREVGETSGRAAVNGVESTRLVGELAALARAEDPTRLSTYASHHRPEDARNFHADVLGYNKYIGWYGGRAEDFAAWLDGVHRKFPALRIGMSEYGAGASISQHDATLTRPVPAGPWHPEEYQAHYHEVYWLALRDRPWVWGKFVWNLFDFAVDDRAEGDTPGRNDKGLVTYDRQTRKDAFYWYKANWSAGPVLHLTSKRFTERVAGPAEVKAYSSAREVELWVNGESRGLVAGDEHRFRWNVQLAPGKNQILVRARAADGTELRDECVLVAR
ncbi:MAG TPA: glycoside hydrolase family 2 TIM barrel-domain containing protein [Opitutaceae bacterium]